ncbi:glycoside hydrolase superfamily [Aspergillus avenaceus]|uniref:glucan 1,3-beta-glucosidase n=1 Tax=Aspergillus avenaceus TaxID=36643 RepID=A0A5N6TP58_ASPAV|nr:glycoside hydrolase superfamily [Aspergillus avenaceus]
MRAPWTYATALGCISSVLAAPHARISSPEYVNWTTFKANGVNLGGWLVQESTVDSEFWGKYSGGADDEWGLCQNLGCRCGPVLEHRYATFITKSDIDKLAHVGVELLRIPTTYAAWIKLPGSQLYSGNQTAYIKQIADYAINQYGMHIVLDVHSLPGGTNGLTIGEATGHWGWFHNDTAFDYSLQTIDAVLSFIQKSDSPQSYTIAPINEPTDANQDMSVFGTPAALTDDGANWVIKYIQAVLEKVASVNAKIPIMFQGSFKQEQYWSRHFSSDANLVFDVHNYYFEHRNVTSENMPSYLDLDARSKAGDGKFPVFAGEWSIQAQYNNSFALRERNVNAGLDAMYKYMQGSCYWAAKFTGNASVDGQGTQSDYWSFQTFIDEGYIDLTRFQ